MTTKASEEYTLGYKKLLASQQIHKYRILEQGELTVKYWTHLLIYATYMLRAIHILHISCLIKM